MGVKVIEKHEGSGIYYLSIHHNGKRKKKKVGMGECKAERLAKILESELTGRDLGLLKHRNPIV